MLQTEKVLLYQASVMRELRALLGFSKEVARHPFSYESALVTMGLAAVAVIAAPWVLPIAWPTGLLVVMSAGFLLAIRLVPLTRFLPTSERAGVSLLRTAVARPFGSTGLGFLASYAAGSGLTALARPPHFDPQPVSVCVHGADLHLGFQSGCTGWRTGSSPAAT